MIRNTDEIFKRIYRLEVGALSEAEIDDVSFRKRHGHDMKTFTKIQEAVKLLADTVNSSGNADIMRSAIVAEFVLTHRYLQGELISLFIGVSEDLVTLYKEKPAMFTDARNEWAYKRLSNIKDAGFGD